MKLKAISLKNRRHVSIEWPAGDAFELSYETITVIDLKLSNENEKMSLAVEATIMAPGGLIRPTRFTVPGKSPAYLTLAFMPGVLFEAEDLKSANKKAVTLKTALPTVDLLDTSPGKDLTEDTLSFSYLPFATKTKDEVVAATQRAYQTPGHGLYASRLHFHCTSPGYVTAYVYLYYSSAYKRSLAWRLTPKTPFWYSLENAGTPGTFPSEGSQHDAYTFGYFPARTSESVGESVFAYIDLKAYGERCFLEGRFNREEQLFLLEAFPLGSTPTKEVEQLKETFSKPFDVQDDKRVTIRLSHDVSENLVKDLSRMRPPKSLHLSSADFSLVFSGWYKLLQSASLTISNDSKAHFLVYRLQAQEPSSFLTKNDSLGKFRPIKPRTSETLTVELNPRVVSELNRNQLFRLDTFLLDKKAESEVDFWPAMMRSMDARQLETTFIPCIFQDEQAVVATSKGQREAIPGTPKDEQPKPGPLTLADNCDSRPDLKALQSGQIRKMSKEETDSACQKNIKPIVPRQIPQVRGHPRPTALHAQKKIPESASKPSWTSHGTHPAPVPNSSALRNRTKDKKKTKKTVSPKPTLAAETQQTLAPRPTAEAASKPSPGSTVKSPSGAANSAQPSPETPPNKPAIINARTASTAPSTSVPGNSLPPTISSVCRQRNAPSQAKKKAEQPKDSKKKENEKKTVSPMRTFTTKAASPGTAKPRTAKSKLVAPSKATRPLSPRSLPLRAPFAPVGDPKPQDLVALLQIIVSLAICLILLNALITALE